MYFKVLCCFAVIATTWAHEHGEAHSSVYITKEEDHHHHHHDGHHDHHSHHGHHDHMDYSSHPKYEFEYKVKDPHTGDIKSEHMSQGGGHFKGHYALHQPDGHERVVHFHGDDKTGFNADVKYNIHHHMPIHKYHHH